MQVEDSSQAAVSNAAQEQGTTKGQPSNKKASVSEKSPEYLAQRFQGDGVRYKAKLIGVDDVVDAQGDKMCLDSMMKLKGQEMAARQRGLHKQRVWLKVSDTCVRIIDEKTGVVEHKHELERVSSVKKDDSQPRAFSYIYVHEGTFKLFFIKMANLADPVIEDIKDAFQIASAERCETLSTQNNPCLLLDEHVAVPPKGLDVIDLFNPLPSSPAQLSALTSCQDELNSVFSVCNESSAPAMSTLEAATGFFGQSVAANLTTWGPAGQPSVSPPGSVGPWGPAGQPSVSPPGSVGPWGPAGQPSVSSPGSLGPWGPAGQPSVSSPGSLGPWGPAGQPSVSSPGSLGPWGPAGQPSVSSLGSLGPWDPAGQPSVPSLGSLGPWGPAGQPSAPSLRSLGPYGSAGQPSAPSPGSLGPWGPAGQPSVPSPGSLGPWGPAGQPSVPSPGSLGPWGPAGQPSAPSPGSLGPWGPAGQPSVSSPVSLGSWDQQQTGWAQPSMGPQTGAQPLGVWTQPAGSMGQVTTGFFTTAGQVSSSGEMMFPQLSVASMSEQHATLQNHPAQAGLHPVSNVFNSRPFDK
ncbi:collagen alpha-1(I) chain-like isoform X2 [Brienomyrus brachyistius]|uniref:collagen alpha-1(I) chain-like isoform X2 n=1 Tax=Brienomyrus brachyistius TaxID=42636 RepID=UPI0020B3B664|nr:collagen alpha-1(I) chain-like isoform X2 [Brienomyrus brachyistius]